MFMDTFKKKLDSLYKLTMNGNFFLTNASFNQNFGIYRVPTVWLSRFYLYMKPWSIKSQKVGLSSHTKTYANLKNGHSGK